MKGYILYSLIEFVSNFTLIVTNNICKNDIHRYGRISKNKSFI